MDNKLNRVKIEKSVGIVFHFHQASDPISGGW